MNELVRALSPTPAILKNLLCLTLLTHSLGGMKPENGRNRSGECSRPCFSQYASAVSLLLCGIGDEIKGRVFLSRPHRNWRQAKEPATTAMMTPTSIPTMAAVDICVGFASVSEDELELMADVGVGLAEAPTAPPGMGSVTWANGETGCVVGVADPSMFTETDVAMPTADAGEAEEAGGAAGAAAGEGAAADADAGGGGTAGSAWGAGGAGGSEAGAALGSGATEARGGFGVGCLKGGLPLKICSGVTVGAAGGGLLMAGGAGADGGAGGSLLLLLLLLFPLLKPEEGREWVPEGGAPVGWAPI